MASVQPSVSFGRVHMIGTRSTVAKARTPLLTALDQAPWPDPGPEEVLFIRHLHLKGNAREIAARAADAALVLARDAADGWTPAADTAPAVRFPRHADMRACLLADILAGRAAGRWFWHREAPLVALPAGEAAARLLAEDPQQLPDILDRLKQTPGWPALWTRIDDSGALRVLAAIGATTAWPLAAASDAGTKAHPFELPRSVLAGLAAYRILTGLDPLSPRVRLAAVIVAWRHLPGRMGTAAGRDTLSALARAIAGADLQSAPPRPVPPPAPTPGLTRQALATGRPGETRRSSGTPTEAAPTPQQSPDQGGRLRPSESPGSTLTQDSTPPANTSNPPTEAADSSPGPESFITTRGGLFYLLNFLALAPVQAILADDPAPGSGWRWLIRLAAGLGIEADAPLAEFLLAETGLPDTAALAALPPLPDEARLLDLAARRYGPEVWQGARFLVPARVLATASHVDLHFRLADVRLPVRQAGLDVNPGWLPWLGRVVSFHYGSPLAPEYRP